MPKELPARKCVLKFHLPTTHPPEQTLRVPSDAVLVHFGPDRNGQLCVWAECTPDLPEADYNLFVASSGVVLPEKAKHLFSCLNGTQNIIWHLHEVPDR